MEPAPRLVLASGSPRRRELIDRMGLAATAIPADVDESVLPGEQPEAYVARLAEAKAVEVLGRLVRADGSVADVVVLGSDTTVVAPDGSILGKPDDVDHARAMLRALSGRTHRVLTGVAVARPDRAPEVRVAETSVTFRPLTDEEIDAYVASGEPMDKAGSYGIQGRGGALVESISGDLDTVIGLPTAVVATLLGT